MSDVVYLSMPNHNGQIDSGAACGLLVWASKEYQVAPAIRASSLLNSNCNYFWCDAINKRLSGVPVKWFAMLHADIEPEAWWLDKLIAIAEENDADMLSACVPIKDLRGLTSTAIASHDDRYRVFARLSQRQLWHDDFPETFDIDQAAEALESLPGELSVQDVPRVGLRLNTGCMICRVDKPWATQCWFDSVNGIELHNGQWRGWDMSEDWRFSMRVQQAGGKLMATRAVKVTHKGVGHFISDKIGPQAIASDADAAPKELLECK